MKIGLVDADLLDNGTRHPNLVLLKIAGLLYDNGVEFELITDTKADVSTFDLIYMSKVFTFTVEPEFFLKADDTTKAKFRIGGTGYYANEKDIQMFREKRGKDMSQLDNDPFLCLLRNNYDDPLHPYGIIILKAG